MGNIGPNFNQPSWQRQQPAGPQPAAPENPPSHPMMPTTGNSLPAFTAEAGYRLALSPLFAFENAVSAQQLGMLLRNLLKMPKEIVQFMALLASVDGESQQELLKTLLTEDAHVSLDDLQTMLTQKMAQGQDKLLKLLQSSQMSRTGSGKDMGDLMSTFAKLATQAETSPMQALHTTLSLYLPYYPLQAPQGFSLYFEPLPDDEEGGQEECQLVLFIETISLGQFKITITASRKIQFQALIDHDFAAEPVLAEIEQQVKDTMTGENIPQPELIFKARPGSTPISSQTLTTKSTNPDRPSVGIHPTGGISVGAIHLAYLLIRIILDLDNRNALNQIRGHQ